MQQCSHRVLLSRVPLGKLLQPSVVNAFSCGFGGLVQPTRDVRVSARIMRRITGAVPRVDSSLSRSVANARIVVAAYYRCISSGRLATKAGLPMRSVIGFASAFAS